MVPLRRVLQVSPSRKTAATISPGRGGAAGSRKPARKSARMCHVKPINRGPSGPFGRAIRYIYATAPDHPEHQYCATAAPSLLSLAAAKSAFGGSPHSWYRSKGTGLRIDTGLQRGRHAGIGDRVGLARA